MISPDADGLLSELRPLLAVVAPDTTFTDVHLAGELDLGTVRVLDAFVEQQIATGRLEVRLDLTELRFCDVVGLRGLLRARRRLAAAGGQLVLLRPAPMLVRLAALCGWSAELGTPAGLRRPLSAVPTLGPQPVA